MIRTVSRVPTGSSFGATLRPEWSSTSMPAKPSGSASLKAISRLSAIAYPGADRQQVAVPGDDRLDEGERAVADRLDVVVLRVVEAEQADLDAGLHGAGVAAEREGPLGRRGAALEFAVDAAVEVLGAVVGRRHEEEAERRAGDGRRRLAVAEVVGRQLGDRAGGRRIEGPLEQLEAGAEVAADDGVLLAAAGRHRAPHHGRAGARRRG